MVDLVDAMTTLSANISSTTLASITWKAYYADAPNDFSTRTQFATRSLSITAVQTDYTIAKFLQHANAGNGIEIEFSVGAFTSGTLTITGVQLERGSVRSLFEMLDLLQQRQRCQAQYCVIDKAIQRAVPGYAIDTYQFPVKMRDTPTATNLVAGTVGLYD